MPKDTADRLAIRDIIENWVIWRDARLWDRFRTLWHKDGWMNATWTQCGYEEFIRMSDAGFQRNMIFLHFLGGSSIDIKGKRAVAQTKMTISQRAPVEGILCDVVCTGRFYDLFEKRKGKWGMVNRQPIYERDRINPVDTTQSVKLDQELLNSFPAGYRHLGYMQTRQGYKVKLDMPGLLGREVEALYAKGANWLKGKKV
jgi:hypothetical protein